MSFVGKQDGAQQRLAKLGLSFSVRKRNKKGATAFTDKVGLVLSETRRGRAPAETNKMGLFFFGEKEEQKRSHSIH